ncbi:hypothetical protein DUNSADRAFT_781 [Dunaliella salina]|uniref:Encoded protein n=1 Tax=Dunaliella salina TaxID=3046 RepID=A0ABQ7FYC4_DUNSA|nr:hypothetical protein DUNSADRAFT_781 [Dunaliella salina]|eukprot:KAF5827372.1 hypothetical protein DUNSADRAFT_781 [Dunaliella salina]
MQAGLMSIDGPVEEPDGDSLQHESQVTHVLQTQVPALPAIPTSVQNVSRSTAQMKTKYLLWGLKICLDRQGM